MRACKLVACTKGEKVVEKWQYQLDFPHRYGSRSPPLREPFPTATEAVPHRWGSRSPSVRKPFATGIEAVPHCCRTGMAAFASH